MFTERKLPVCESHARLMSNVESSATGQPTQQLPGRMPDIASARVACQPRILLALSPRVGPDVHEQRSNAGK
jgi:hypothetical protein